MERSLAECDVEDIQCLKTEDGELGSGLLGTVLLGQHAKFGDVAVKCFRVPGGRQEKLNIEKSIRNEMEMLQKANNDNIVRLFGWTKWPHAMALVMEYMAGGNLNNILFNDEVDLRPGLLLRMCHDISNALAFIHNLSSRQRLTHGDLKPENILVTMDIICKVGDFGSSKLSNVTGVTTVASTSSTKKNNEYTKAFASPELLTNPLAAVTKEHDAFSYGMVLYVMVFRENPQGRARMSDYIEEIKHGNRPPMERISELKDGKTRNEIEIIDALVLFIKSCWQHNPQDRPSMIEVRNKQDELLRMQDIPDITIQVSDAQRQMNISKPKFRPGVNCAPLHSFNPELKCFVNAGEAPPAIAASRATHAPMTSADQAAGDRLLSEASADDWSTVPKTPVSISPSTSNAPSTSTDGYPRPAPRGVRTNNPPTSNQPFVSGPPIKEEQLERMEQAGYSFQTTNWPASADQGTEISNSPSSHPQLAVDLSELSVGEQIGTPQRPSPASAPSNPTSSVTNPPLSFDEMFKRGEGEKLVQNHKQALEQEEFDRARQIAVQVFEFIKSNSNTKAPLVKGRANKHRNEKKFLLAILFYEVAQLSYVHAKNHQTTVTGINVYIEDVSKMCQENSGDFQNATLRAVICHYVIPYMLELVEIRQNLPAMPNTDLSKSVANLWLAISQTGQVVGKTRVSRTHLEKAIEVVKAAHGKKDPLYRELVQKLQNHGRS